MIRFIRRELGLCNFFRNNLGLNINRPADVAEDVVLHAFKTRYRHVGEQVLRKPELTN